MTMATNAQNTYASIGIREDLEDVVYRIDPDKTPFLSNLTTDVVGTQTKHEWQTDSLAAASTTNAQLEGDVIVGSAATPTDITCAQVQNIVGGGSGGVDRHTPIKLAPGHYEVRIQRSFQSGMSRRVED